MNRTDEEALAYSVADAVRVSAIGRTKLYELIAAGRIRAMKAGGRTLVCAPSLRAYLAGLPAMPVRAPCREPSTGGRAR